MANETDATLDDVADDLERTFDLPAEDALDVLRSARRDLQAIRREGTADEDHRQTLERRLEQRRREVCDRDAYDAGGGTGAATNPDEENAP